MPTSVRLEMTDDESAYLDDILSIWIDGYEDAKDHAMVDPMIKQAEELIEVTGGLIEQQSMAREIRYRLRESRNDNRTD